MLRILSRSFSTLFSCSLPLLALTALALSATAATKPEIVRVEKIWDHGAHNAFTDLIFWQDSWWCTFREAEDHIGGDGAIQVLNSKDGKAWKSVARLTERGVDLRDPKFSVTPDNRLMLNCGGSIYEGKTFKGKRSRVLFSKDGITWTAPQPILSENEWCWRVTWHDGVAYAAVYRSTTTSNVPGPEWTMTIYSGTDGVNWKLVKQLDVAGRPNETTLRFTSDGEMIALVRREAGDRMGWVGRAKAPYTDWKWQPSNHRFGGQNFIQLPDGRWIVGTRDYRGATTAGSTKGSRTIIAELESNGHLKTLVTLPSDNDTSYPGLVWHNDQLAVSYYSTHEGKTSIYFAEVKL